jgi:hypothetical protein
MRNETIDLNKALITSAVADIDAWERWTELVPSGPARAFNLSLIRLTKGLVKAWRIYLLEQGQHTTIGSSLPHGQSPSDQPNKEMSYHGKSRMLS